MEQQEVWEEGRGSTESMEGKVEAGSLSSRSLVLGGGRGEATLVVMAKGVGAGEGAVAESAGGTVGAQETRAEMEARMEADSVGGMVNMEQQAVAPEAEVEEQVKKVTGAQAAKAAQMEKVEMGTTVGPPAPWVSAAATVRVELAA